MSERVDYPGTVTDWAHDLVVRHYLKTGCSGSRFCHAALHYFLRDPSELGVPSHC